LGDLLLRLRHRRRDMGRNCHHSKNGKEKAGRLNPAFEQFPLNQSAVVMSRKNTITMIVFFVVIPTQSISRCYVKFWQVCHFLTNRDNPFRIQQPLLYVSVEPA
jgi:hypothetical protein